MASPASSSSAGTSQISVRQAHTALVNAIESRGGKATLDSLPPLTAITIREWPQTSQDYYKRMILVGRHLEPTGTQIEVFVTLRSQAIRPGYAPNIEFLTTSDGVNFDHSTKKTMTILTELGDALVPW